ncbi:ribonuclease H-like domain-containing protein, partial [Lipomyces starkeyi]
IYTDGCALNNGKSGSLAGVGVYYGPNDSRNISTYLPGERQTNQRAELTAILLAVKEGPRFRHIEIRTDSTYSIKCVEEWSIKWRQNGWRNAKGQQVENADLIKQILDEIEVRRGRGARVKFMYVAGHSGIMGNENADRLANLGAL